MTIGLTIIFAGIMAVQIPRLVKEKMWKELIVYLALFSLGIIYSFGLIYQWPLPNPTKRMERLFEPAWKILEKILT